MPLRTLNYLWKFRKNLAPFQTSFGLMCKENQFETIFIKKRMFPATTPLSDTISKDLKKRGFKFVGPTVIYAFMQAVGMVNDHTTDCFKYQQ